MGVLPEKTYNFAPNNQQKKDKYVKNEILRLARACQPAPS